MIDTVNVVIGFGGDTNNDGHKDQHHRELFHHFLLKLFGRAVRGSELTIAREDGGSGGRCSTGGLFREGKKKGTNERKYGEQET